MSLQLSKREQKKLQKAIQLIEASQPGDSRPRKKRKLSPQCCINPITPNTHTPNTHTPNRLEQNQKLQQTKSTHQLTPFSQKVRQAEESVQMEDKSQCRLNGAYPLQNTDLGTYLIAYQYRQAEKQLQKEYADWSSLGELGEGVVMHHYSSTDLCRRVGKVIASYLKGGTKIFSKEHKEFSQFLLRFAGPQLKN